MAELWDAAPVWMRVLGVVAFVGLALGVLAVAGTDFSEQEGAPPAIEQPELDAESAADLIAADRFCRAYASALSAGFGDDFAYGNFLRGYQKVNVDVPAREVYDELVGRC